MFMYMIYSHFMRNSLYFKMEYLNTKYTDLKHQTIRYIKRNTVPGEVLRLRDISNDWETHRITGNYYGKI